MAHNNNLDDNASSDDDQEEQQLKKVLEYRAKKINQFYQRENFIQHEEWRFSNNFHRNTSGLIDRLIFNGDKSYDEFYLNNVNLADYTMWLKSVVYNGDESVGFATIDYLPNDLERRYELIDLPTNSVMVRIKTIQAGLNLTVYSRGAVFKFRNDSGRKGPVLVFYYGAYRYFYLEMINQWSLPHTTRYQSENNKFPDYHEIWKHSPIDIFPRSKIQYPARDNSINTELMSDPNNLKVSKQSGFRGKAKFRKDVVKEKIRTEQNKDPNVTQEQLAEILNISVSTVKRRLDEMQKTDEPK